MNAIPQQQLWFTSLFWKRVLIGAGIGLVLISVFLLGVDDPNPAWPQGWWIRPMLLVPLTGASGGLVYHLLCSPAYTKGWMRFTAKVLGVLVYIISLWLGSVLRLDGTLWN